MVFSSVIFLCFFLVFAVAGDLLIPGVRGKNIFLTIVSLLFYAYGEPVFVFYLLALVLIHHLAGCCIRRKERYPRFLLAVLLTLDVGTLFVCKYTGFVCESLNSLLPVSLPVPEIQLPIGISFFTFQMMSYTIDCYRDISSVQKSFGNLLLYISFFPQLIAGPIVKYADIAPYLTERKSTLEDRAQGLSRFVVGLSKKVILSNAMAAVADEVFSLPDHALSMPVVWLASVSYAFQLYYDFSGYSDMAIGLGRIFGFRFPENFNYPYSALSVQDFWKRWHISLTSWFREYVYIPMGGNRKGKGRTVGNILIVFLLTGIWHGAAYTFILWGLYHAFFMIMERLEIIPIHKIRWKIPKWLYMTAVSFTGFLIFRAGSVQQAFSMLHALVHFRGLDGQDFTAALGMTNPYFFFILALCVLFAFPVLRRIGEKYCEKAWAQPVQYAVYAVLLVVCMIFLVTDSYNPFIYFHF